MVAELDSNASSSFELELLSSWAGRQGLTCSHSTPSSAVPRCAASSDLTLGDFLRRGGCSAMPYQDESFQEESDTLSTLSSSSLDGPTFTFTPMGAVPFDFQLVEHAVPEVVKRCRHRLDVDGPNTAPLSSKKRRLRADLITSRLSQPYSLPATHILNREGMKSGDKRFLQMATSLDVARRIAHLHATSFLRYSVMNRLRRKLGLGRPGQRYEVEDEEEVEEEPDAKRNLETTSKAPWRPQSLEASSGGKYIRPSRDASAASASSHSPKAQACRISMPAALPLPPSDLAAAKRRPSSRIHSIRSPEMRPDHASYDELEDENFSFSHLDDEGFSDLGDDPEHVYSDFSVIFSGGASDDDQSYEEYLDELDGISWVAM